jgi:zinc protease
VRPPFRWACVLGMAVALGCAGEAAAQVKDWPSSRPPAPLPRHKTPFPAYDIRTMPNGMSVVVVQHTELPVVSAQVLVKAGSAFDPPGKAGVAGLVASLLDQGTATRSAGETADAVETAGAELSVLSGGDVTFAEIAVTKEHVDFALSTLADVLRNPAFAQEELDRQRQQLLSSLAVSYGDPDYVANVVFERLVFGVHPYGFPGDGTPESVGRITRDDLMEFHRRYYVPNNCILALVGDISPDAAFALAARVFGGWPRREVNPPKAVEPPPPARRVVIVDMPDVVQTEIRVGHVAIPRQHRDYLAFDLGMRILGGEGGNRLQQKLRTSRGLTYGASADLRAYRTLGMVQARTNTRPETTPEALRAIVDEFNAIVREGVSRRELDSAKAYATGSFPLELETPRSLSTKILDALYHEVPVDELESYAERVDGLTLREVVAAMRAHLRPDRLSMALVGPAAVMTPLLRRKGFKDVEVVPLADLDSSAASLRRPAPAAKQAPSAAVLPCGRR